MSSTKTIITAGVEVRKDGADIGIYHWSEDGRSVAHGSSVKVAGDPYSGWFWEMIKSDISSDFRTTGGEIAGVSAVAVTFKDDIVNETVRLAFEDYLGTDLAGVVLWKNFESSIDDNFRRMFNAKIPEVENCLQGFHMPANASLVFKALVSINPDISSSTIFSARVAFGEWQFIHGSPKETSVGIDHAKAMENHPVFERPEKRDGNMFAAGVAELEQEREDNCVVTLPPGWSSDDFDASAFKFSATTFGHMDEDDFEPFVKDELKIYREAPHHLPLIIVKGRYELAKRLWDEIGEQERGSVICTHQLTALLQLVGRSDFNDWLGTISHQYAKEILSLGVIDAIERRDHLRDFTAERLFGMLIAKDFEGFIDEQISEAEESIFESMNGEGPDYHGSLIDQFYRLTAAMI